MHGRSFSLRFMQMLCLVLPGIAGAAAPSCPPADYDRAALTALKAEKFELADDARRNALALALVECLGDPDRELRDGIAYEALTAWMRAGRLDVDTRRALLADLSAALDPKRADAAGFRQPFSALILAEVARTDRVDIWLTKEQRNALVETAVHYLESVRDYRGFVEGEGWRHGVAHGADLLTQLALNPELDKAQLDRILGAVATQVAPAGTHAYIDGESERLARPVLLVALRELHSAADWDRWFQTLAAPAPLASWAEDYSSREGLAKRHNLLAFLRAVYVGAREGGDDKLGILVPSVQATLKALP